jgi:hypothetical protein
VKWRFWTSFRKVVFRPFPDQVYANLGGGPSRDRRWREPEKEHPVTWTVMFPVH